DVVVAVAGEQVHGEAARLGSEVDLAELEAVPGDPRSPRVVLEERPPAKRGVGATETEQAAHEAELRALLVAYAPAHPARLVVLAVRVVVAALGPVELVPAQDHGHSLRDEQQRQEVPRLAPAEGEHVGVRRLPLHAAVP